MLDKKADLNKVRKNHYQIFTETQCNELLKLLQKSEEFLMEHLVPEKQI